MRAGEGASEEKSKKPMIAGILMITAFILALVTAGNMFFLDTSALNLEEGMGGQVDQIDQSLIENIINICGALILIFGVFLLVGGIFAIKRIHWGFTLAASIIGIFSIGFQFVGSILSVIALILVFISKDEFKGKGEELPPEQNPSFEQQ